jgi:hypothetical protein
LVSFVLNKSLKSCRCMTPLPKDYLRNRHDFFHTAKVQKTSHFFIFLSQINFDSKSPPTRLMGCTVSVIPGLSFLHSIELYQILELILVPGGLGPQWSDLGDDPHTG